MVRVSRESGTGNRPGKKTIKRLARTTDKKEKSTWLVIAVLVSTRELATVMDISVSAVLNLSLQ